MRFHFYYFFTSFTHIQMKVLRDKTFSMKVLSFQTVKVSFCYLLVHALSSNKCTVVWVRHTHLLILLFSGSLSIFPLSSIKALLKNDLRWLSDCLTWPTVPGHTYLPLWCVSFHHLIDILSFLWISVTWIFFVTLNLIQLLLFMYQIFQI